VVKLAPAVVRASNFASRSFTIALTVLVAVVYCVRVATAQTPPETTALADAIGHAHGLIQKDIAPKVPGVSAAVGVDGKIVWSEGFGFKDIAAKAPVTTTTRFRVGSISKSITSAGVALLVERGQLDLDAPVQKYVPDFPDKGGPITTRLLGGHLAGIRHYQGNEMLLNRPYTNVHAGLAIFQDDPLVAAPGTQYHYSTYGWSLISAVIESAAHEDFLSFMDENVIHPLGMTHTRADRKGAVDSDRTQFYQNDGQGKFVVAPSVDNSYKWAGGGYLSTPEDLVRFGSALLHPGFLKKESLALLFTPQKTSDGKPTTYGIGWNIGKDAHDHRILMHTGGSIGGTSVLLLHPETRTVVALVCNHTTMPFAKKDWESIAELFGPIFKAVSKTKNP
jgi:CubicO group peptidase (beta-lactamase class C family)